MKNKAKITIHSATELKSLEALEVENKKVLSSMKGRNTETSKADKELADLNKRIAKEAGKQGVRIKRPKQ